MRAKPGEATETMLRLLLTRSDDCIVWPHTVNSKGYGQVGIAGKSTSVHVVACQHFHGPRPAGMQAAHSCGNKRCVNGAHLRWATPAENEHDKAMHGTVCNGERNGRAKLTAAQVETIRSRTSEHATVLALEFGVSRRSIDAIRRNHAWVAVETGVAS